jgi:signal transduction histidine kinase
MSTRDVIAASPEPAVEGPETREVSLRAEPEATTMAPTGANGTARARANAFVLLRSTLMIAVGYLLLAELGLGGVSWSIGAVFAVALLSNVWMLFAPRAWVDSQVFTAGVVIADTLWITVALILAGRFSSEFFYLYFFILFLAAIGENLRLIVLGTMVVCAAYVVAIISTRSVAHVLETQFLIRIPFLFAVAVFYGYLVDRLRVERSRTKEEAAVITRLRESQSAFEEANRALIAEAQERERIQETLQSANERLQELGEIRSRFFTTVSHEIKTPLTSIKNSVSLFRARRSADDNEKLLDMISRNADRLNYIISDMLDMSRVESGSLRIRADSVDLEALIDEVLASLRQQADDAGITLELRSEEPLPLVWADRRRVDQILKDLTSNALRATSRGGSVQLRPCVGNDWVELNVQDTGIGLTAVERKRIFEPFFQTGDGLVDRPPGAGLGLTICRDLARGHGSELDVESSPGVGSRFFFSLPVYSPRAAELLEFEDEMRLTYRKYPNFALVVVQQGLSPAGAKNGPTLDERTELLKQLMGRLREILPGANDHLIAQPAHGRVLVVLLTTPRQGAWVVRRRLDQGLKDFSMQLKNAKLPSPRVCGPSCYPDDGLFGRLLIDTALSIDHDGEES